VVRGHCVRLLAPAERLPLYPVLRLIRGIIIPVKVGPGVVDARIQQVLLRLIIKIELCCFDAQAVYIYGPLPVVGVEMLIPLGLHYGFDDGPGVVEEIVNLVLGGSAWSLKIDISSFESRRNPRVSLLYR